MTTALRPRARSIAGYRPFPDVERRNACQESMEVPAMVRALSLPRAARVLEVGCGRGVALPPLARFLRPIRLTGIDVDPAMVARALHRVREQKVPADVYCADVRHLPFDTASYDVVIDFGTCYHIAAPARALTEIARVLAPGGFFVHETRVSQLLSHPVRSFGRHLPWGAVPSLVPDRSAVLWNRRLRR